MAAFLEGIFKLLAFFAEIAFWVGLALIVLFVLFVIASFVGTWAFTAFFL